MLQVTFNESDRILLDMADDAEAAKEYCQITYGSGCGSPACMLGTYAWRHPESPAHKYITAPLGREFLRARAALLESLQMDNAGYDTVFGPNGCGDAGSDGKKAAAFVREFVRQRALARVNS